MEKVKKKIFNLDIGSVKTLVLGNEYYLGGFKEQIYVFSCHTCRIEPTLNRLFQRC